MARRFGAAFEITNSAKKKICMTSTRLHSTFIAKLQEELAALKGKSEKKKNFRRKGKIVE